MNGHLDGERNDWALRPWLLAIVAMLGGLAFHFLTDHWINGSIAVWRQAAATFVAIGTLSLVLTVERPRWSWSVAFALGWGIIVALVGWSTARYNRDPTIFEWPYLSAIFAVMIAAPLFQTIRDERAWRFPYGRLHNHAWTDAVIGAASLMFTGVVFLLAWLIAGLFDLIGIEAVRKLLQKDWFGWMLAGFAFGAAVGLLREREALLGTLRRLVMIVYSVLAPVLAVALALFLLSIPFTGLSKLWDSGVPATPLLLLAAAGAILLANAVIGDGEDDRSTNPLLGWSALVLVAVILPLTLIAAYSMAIRIGQYGWTPERIWGVVATGVAVAYGAAGWWAIAKGRRDYDELLRPLQVKLAIGLCGLALVLALPILDFGAISTRSQVARLESGKVDVAKFDWRALAFEFGPSGRRQLAAMATSGDSEQRMRAATALAAKNRWGLSEVELAAGPAPTQLTVIPAGATVPDDLKAQLLGGSGVKDPFCSNGGACLVYPQAGGMTFIVMLDGCANLPAARRDDPKTRCSRTPGVFEQRKGKWVNVYGSSGLSWIDRPGRPGDPGAVAELRGGSEALERGEVRLVPVTRRQLEIGGRPTGDPFE